MIRLPLKKTGKEAKKKAGSASGNTFRKSNQWLKDLAEKKEGVDGNKKVLHNLISLVLTNKTICSEAENTKWSVAF